MSRLVLRRVAALALVLLALTVVVFLIQAVIPADPVRAQLGLRADKELVEQKRHELGYDQPLPVQYVDYMQRVLSGDLGDSLRTRNPVSEDLRRFAPATIELATCSFVLALVLGVGMGIISARRGRTADGARGLMVSMASVPTFLVAIILLLVFYRWLGWLPASGRLSPEYRITGGTGLLLYDTLAVGNVPAFFDAAQHLIMPSICLALGPAVAIGRTLRVSLLDQMGNDYIRTARAKGMSGRRVVYRHAFRNALGPVLAISGLAFGSVLAGATVVEQVLGWPGLGSYTTQSIQSIDFPAVTGVVLVMGVVYVTLNAVVDVIQLVADPRMRAAALE